MRTILSTVPTEYCFSILELRTTIKRVRVHRGGGRFNGFNPQNAELMLYVTGKKNITYRLLCICFFLLSYLLFLFSVFESPPDREHTSCVYATVEQSKTHRGGKKLLLLLSMLLLLFFCFFSSTRDEHVTPRRVLHRTYSASVARGA